MTIMIPSDGKWDFIHRFRNFGEDIYIALRDKCSMSIHEIDSSTDRFTVRDIPEEMTAHAPNIIWRIAEKHFLAERLQLITENAEPTSPGDVADSATLEK